MNRFENKTAVITALPVELAKQPHAALYPKVGKLL